MPVWLMPILIKVWDFIWHAIKRFGSVILIALLIIVPIFSVRGCIHKKELAQYNLGYKAGYAQAIKDNPTQSYGTVGTVINIQDGLTPIFSLYRVGLYWKNSQKSTNPVTPKK